MRPTALSRSTLSRLPLYLQSVETAQTASISATRIAKELHLGEGSEGPCKHQQTGTAQIRISDGGTPEGYHSRVGQGLPDRGGDHRSGAAGTRSAGV